MLVGQRLIPSRPMSEVAGGKAAREKTTWLPCSREQEGVWLAEQMVESAASHCAAMTLQLAMDLTDRELCAAASACMRRHEQLRSQFSARDGRLHYAVLLAGEQPAAKIDRAGASTETLPHLLSTLTGARLSPLEWPPFRFTIVEVNSALRLVHFVCHHAVCDGLSLLVLERDFAEVCAAIAEGHPPALPGPGQPYAMFVQHQLREISRLENDARTYWTPALRTASVASRMWARRSVSRGREMPGDSVLVISSSTGRRLGSYAQDRGVSMFVVLLAIVQVVQRSLADGCGAVATTVAMDARPSTMNEAVGMFASEGLVCTPVRLGSTFDEHLACVQAAVRGLLAIRGFPGTEAIARFGAAGHYATIKPEVTLSYMRLHTARESRQRVRSEWPIGVPRQIARHGLSIFAAQASSDLQILTSYDGAVACAADAATFVDTLAGLLDRAITGSTVQLADLLGD